MSIIPLQKVECGPLEPRRYPPEVIGSPNCPLGYRLRERSKCKVARQPEAFEQFEQEKRREYEQLTKTWEFEEHTNGRIKRKKVWRHVQQGMAAYEDAVNTRRDKLREVLLREEMGLTREVVDQAQHGDDARMDEMRGRIAELRRQEEEQRLAVVAAKRMQRYLTQCPQVRERLTAKSTVEAKLCNLAQMADNEARKQAEKELDNLWHGLMMKEVETKKLREAEEAKTRGLVGQEAIAILAKQMAGKLALEERKKCVREEDREYAERLREELRQEELQRREKERERREALKKDLQEQILIAKRQLAERARREAEIDRLRQTLAEEELAKERARIKESSADLRRELLAYLQYLEDLRNEEARRNVELDRVVEQSTREAFARRDEAVKKLKESRAKSLREVLLGREQQLRIKCEREKEELERRRSEKEAVEKEIELEAKLAARAKEEAKCRMLHYRRDLEDQRKLTDEAKRGEAEEDAKRQLEELRKRDEYQNLTEELLRASENITPHPFKVLLKECAARYAAELEGLCYCPPPIATE